MRYLMVTLMAAVVSTGCNPERGVRREATLVGMPDIDCMRRVISEHEYIAYVRVFPDSREQNPTLMEQVGVDPVTLVYEGNPDSFIFGELSLRSSSLEGVQMDHASASEWLTQDYVEASRPFMARLERELESACDLEWRDTVSERCFGWGITCEPKDWQGFDP